MTAARYLFRMDDITPTMDWGRFWALLRLFERYRVKPLLGVIPDNHDHSLNRQEADPCFWEKINLLVERNLVDIAQHGYQHILERSVDSFAPERAKGHTLKRSEFAGYSFQEQLEKLLKGREILQQRGLSTDYFFAPNHSFDHTTLCALKTAGFSAVSDGHALRPFTQRGLVFVPQQLWRPMWMPTGVFTICLHTNEITPQEVKGIRQFLRTPARITSFTDEAGAFQRHPADSVLNSLFSGAYTGTRAVRDTLRAARKTTKTKRLMPPPPSIDHSPMGKGSISSL